jgi:hypothetical protein
MRSRTTFLSRSTLVIAPQSDMLVYGPTSAESYAVIKSRHDAIVADRGKAISELQPYRSLVYRYHGRCGSAQLLSKAFPDEWARLYPWCRLSREGTTEMMIAAMTDTREYVIAELAGLPEPFTAFDSPREAYAHYNGKG